MKSEKDENIFLKAISNVISDKYLLSNKIKKPISEEHLYLGKDFKSFQIDDDLKSSLYDLTKQLKCSYEFSKGGLYQYLDLMVLNHPKLGSRLIEFDEEQHFTVFRKETILKIESFFPLEFWTDYISYCSNIYYQNQMLKKNRIKYNTDKLIGNIQEFEYIISNYTNTNNGYVEPKQDFPFVGGRIAQRAYFDSIRDIIHFDRRNKHLKPIIRISKIDIEKTYNQPFNRIKLNQIEDYVRSKLLKINGT
jgi:hypothetical protein